MRVIRKNNILLVDKNNIRPGDCFSYRGNILIATGEVDLDDDYVVCVNLENGKFEYINFNEKVSLVKACVTVEY